MSHRYPLVTSPDEVARLRMQADLYRNDADQMLREIGVRPGWRCLDLCCGVGGITDVMNYHVGSTGEVVGLDFDQAKLDVAQTWAKINGLTKVRYVQGDAFATGLRPQSFDLVHTRFALGIVPNGIGMLSHMLELLRPGGVIFLQEVEFDSIYCYPPHPAWDRCLQVIYDCFQGIGADLYLGRKLHGLLLEAGIEVIHLRPCSRVLRAGEPMQFHIPRSLDAMRPALAELNLISDDELTEVLAAAHDHLSRPETVTGSITMMQAVGRKAG